MYRVGLPGYSSLPPTANTHSSTSSCLGIRSSDRPIAPLISDRGISLAPRQYIRVIFVPEKPAS